jgi:hypothetical protein
MCVPYAFTQYGSHDEQRIWASTASMTVQDMLQHQIQLQKTKFVATNTLAAVNRGAGSSSRCFDCSWGPGFSC